MIGSNFIETSIAIYMVANADSPRDSFKKESKVKQFKPTAKEIADMGGVIGYPEPGRYVIMTDGDIILGGEIERPGEFRQQIAALPKYYPEGSTRYIVTLDADGTFTQTII